MTHNPQTDSSPVELWAVVPAAGTGSRMSASVPKQYLPLMGKPVLQHAIDTLLGISKITGIVVVIAKDDQYWSALSINDHDKVHTVFGGSTRADSVIAGVDYVCKNSASGSTKDTMVLVHDAARAMTALSDIQRLIEQVNANPEHGGLLAVPVQDTLKKAQASSIEATVSRENLWHAQTPQYFRAHDLLASLRANHDAIVSGEITDEACAIEQTGKQPLLVESYHPNFKLTRQNDFVLAAALLSANENTVHEKSANEKSSNETSEHGE